MSDKGTRWNYYFSGIIYGEFCVDGDHPLYRWRDAATGSLGSWAELTAEKSRELLLFARLDVYEMLPRVALLEKLFSEQPSEVHTPFGDDYLQREPGVYAQQGVALPVDLSFLDGELIAFICPSREACVLLVREGFEEHTVLRAWREIIRQRPLYPVKQLDTFSVRMRDGIQLSTDVYLPKGAGGALPTILVRTCYDKRRNRELLYRYVQRGYALVLQDVRGRDASEGDFVPMYHEISDGDDTLNWVATQPWCNGQIGTIGGSYLGFVQWAMAASGNPHLKAMVSMVTSGSAFVDIPLRGGLLNSGTMAWVLAMSEQTLMLERMVRDDWDELLSVRPLEALPERALGKRIPFFDTWIAHPTNDDFWKHCDWYAGSRHSEVPALILSGWFDDDGMGTTQALELTRHYAEGTRKVILGPWGHNANSRYDLHGVPMGKLALRYDLDLLYLEWFEQHLRGAEPSSRTQATVEYFTLGENSWKTANTWPPEGCEEYSLYLGAGGVLLDSAGRSGADAYEYDPKNPAPHVIDPSENEAGVPEDYTEMEQRPDVLCYTTLPLEHDLVVTGELALELYISSDAVDTDFVVRLTEVNAEGVSIKYSDGVLGAKFRNGFEQPEYLEPSKVYCLRIPLNKLSKRFSAGNRIRCTVTSSAKGFAFPGSNTARGYNSETTVKAHNKVHFGAEYPSRLILSVETPF